MTKYPMCSRECYYELIRNDKFQESRQGQRIGREVLSRVINMEEEYVVHHEDGAEFNNDLGNLYAFRNASGHNKYHRGGEVEAFVGATQNWQVVQKDLVPKRKRDRKGASIRFVPPPPGRNILTLTP